MTAWFSQVFSGGWRRWAPLLTLFVAALILSFIPIVQDAWAARGVWQGVPPSNDNSYFTRMREIVDGKPFLGNPYFIEHRDDLSPAFFVADWIASIPLLIGIPLIPTLLINLAIWSLINAFLFYKLFRELGGKPWASATAGLLVFITVYVQIVRPVSMQVVFPVFLLFCLAALHWLKNPSNPKRIVYLALALTLSVYIYTYLTQIALAFFIIALGRYVWRREWKNAFATCAVVAGAGLLSLPFAVYTLFQVTHPYYWESMIRIGLITTHLPTLNAFTNLWWMIVPLLPWMILLRRAPESDRTQVREQIIYFILMAAAMIVISFSNVITAKELETAEHVDRFIAIWFIVMIAAVAFFVQRHGWRHTGRWERTALVALLLVNLYGVKTFIHHHGTWTFGFAPAAHGETARFEQAEAPALAWLESHESKPVVIWAPVDSPINNNITILTKHYVLFSSGGILHLVSDREVEDRYLLSKSLEPITTDDLIRDYKAFAGAGNAVHEHMTHNRGVRMCQLLRLNLFGMNCGVIHDRESFQGRELFQKLADHATNEILPHQADYLARFHVSYAISDDVLHPGQRELLRKLPGATEVYADRQFAIFRLEQTPQGVTPSTP